MPRAQNLFRVRGLVLMLLAVIVIAAIVLAASSIQRSAEQRAFERVQHTQQLLSVWLDRTNALRGYLLNGSTSALQASAQSVRPYQAALRTQQIDVRNVPGAQAILANEMQFAQRWQKWAAVSVSYIRQHGVRPLPLTISKPRSSAAAALQSANERLTAVMEDQRARDIAAAAKIGDGIVVLAFLVVALAALAVARADRHRERRAMETSLLEEQDRAADERAYVEGRRRLSQMLLAAESTQEACQLAKTAIESRVPGSSVVALKGDSDAGGLAFLTAAPQSVELARSLDDATPRSCLAIRLAGAQTSDPNEPSPVRCELCGRDGYARCEPLFAGAEVTGSMLITHPAPLTAPQRRAIDDTVAYLTPVLANLRNLAQAQNRAQTDPLTDLPNRRALDPMLKRMFAQANRTGAPLSLVLVDVDHFKDVNDTLGHECGDELLMAVATALAQSVRASDFVARLGGDEFVVALPATDLMGAGNVAQKLAAAAANARVLGFDWEITVSVGLASYPVHGANVEAVMRSADTALYEAKKVGRNCVRLAPVIPPVTTVLTTTGSGELAGSGDDGLVGRL